MQIAAVGLGPWRVKIGTSRVGVSLHIFPPGTLNGCNASLANMTAFPVRVLALHFSSPVVNFRDVRFTVAGGGSGGARAMAATGRLAAAGACADRDRTVNLHEWFQGVGI